MPIVLVIALLVLLSVGSVVAVGFWRTRNGGKGSRYYDHDDW